MREFLHFTIDPEEFLSCMLIHLREILSSSQLLLMRVLLIFVNWPETINVLLTVDGEKNALNN
jgi:hypothetical protein